MEPKDRPRRKPGLDNIAANEHRTHPPASRAADIRRLQSMLRCHQPYDGAMLAMAPQRAHDRLGLDPHPRG